MLGSLMGKLRLREPNLQGGGLRTEGCTGRLPGLGGVLTSVEGALGDEGASLFSAPMARAPRDFLWLFYQVPRQPQSPAGLRRGD